MRKTSFIASFAIVAALFACTDSEESPKAGPPGTTPAAGGGVCCPMDMSPCSPGYRGGWAPSAGECKPADDYDGRFDERIDDHGCEYWQSAYPTGAYCCGCPSLPDGSDDASSDAGPSKEAGSSD
jgi:hypothetical protein